MSRPRTMDKHMMATKAFHKLGDISSDEPDLCHVYDQDGENYYGMWVTGFGFFDVRFPKETTRDLTNDEIKYYNSKRIQINNQPSVPLHVGEPNE